MGSNVITQGLFLDKLQRMKDTTLIPGCHRVATVQDGTTRRSVTLWSDTRARSDLQRAVVMWIERQMSTAYLEIRARQTGYGWRSTTSDALISEVRDVYGSFDAEGDVLVAHGVSSPGVPEQRWIYATRRSSWRSTPPTLHLLSLDYWYRT